MRFNTVLEAIAHFAKNTPEKTCLIDAESDKSFTYKEFWHHILVFAKRLKDAGVKKGENITVRVGGVLETNVAQFGIHLAGGVYCPVEKHMKEAKLLEMLEYFESKFLVSAEAMGTDVNWIDLLSVCEGGEIMTDDEIVFPNGEEMCAIVFTTGTTGKAKGVMISYRKSAYASQTRGTCFGYTDKDVHIWVNPLDSNAGILAACDMFVLGGTAVHYGSIVFADGYFDSMQKHGVTSVYLQSFSLLILLKALPEKFSEFKDQIRMMFLAGGAVSEAVKKQMVALLPKTRLFINYSSTESSAMAYYEFSRHKGKSNCAGKPYPATEILIVDDEGNPILDASKSNPGIIACESNGIMLGYWKDPELTSRTLRNGRIMMTDVGYFDEKGFLYILGRRDDVIVSGGRKIAPYEVEDVTMQMPGVLECACVPLENRSLGKVPKLYVLMRPGYEFSASEIIKYLSGKLESFKIPRIVEQVQDMPRIPGGSLKINRRALVENE